jgi:uncharacterized protein YggE
MKKAFLLQLVLFLGLSLFAQLQDNLLKIKGNAILYQVPEIMYVNIPIQITDSLYENCSVKLTKVHKQLKDELIANGIKKNTIKTDDLNVGEKTKWTREGRISDGFQGSVSVRIEMEYSPKMLNKIINTLKDNSFNFGYNVNFGLSEEQKLQTLENAIESAISDAERKAEIIAKKLNVKLSEIQEVNFGYSTGSFDILTPENDAVFYDLEEEEDSEESLVMDINPKKVRIDKTINVIWKIEK